MIFDPIRTRCQTNASSDVGSSSPAIAEGFDTINDQLKASQHPALYCSPDKLNGDQLIDILRKWVKATRAKSPRIDKAPPGTALLYALQDAFPCSK
jgi:hypothetical protein